MKGKIKRMCAAIAAAAGITLACTMPAAAYSDGAVQQEKAEEAENPGPLEEQPPDKTASTPFSTPGNGILLDDVEDDGTSKQFLSIQTKNGNTFYIVVDRSGNTENVYMLSLVDENDLAEFIDEAADSREEPAEEEITGLALDLVTSTDEEADDGQEDDGKQEKGTGMGGIIPVILILDGSAAGLYYYFKVIRPQKGSDNVEEESLEFYNDYEESGEDVPEKEE